MLEIQPAAWDGRPGGKGGLLTVSSLIISTHCLA